MSDFITLACPSCGGSLRITDDVERFACKYCGREHLVRRRVDRGGHAYVDLEPVVAKLAKIDRKMDRHSSELAIQRLRQDRRGLKARIDEWRDEYSVAKADADRSKTRLVSAIIFLVLSVVGGVIAVVASRGDGAGACLGLVASVVVLVAAIVLLVQVVRLPGLNGQVRAAKHRLDRLYDQLDEVEAELAYHERVVRS